MVSLVEQIWPGRFGVFFFGLVRLIGFVWFDLVCREPRASCVYVFVVSTIELVTSFSCHPLHPGSHHSSLNNRIEPVN